MTDDVDTSQVDPNTVQVLATMQKTRRLKMAYNISQRTGGRVAAIRFSGQYLEALGFRHDGYFFLTINPEGSIVLTPAPAPEPGESVEG